MERLCLRAVLYVATALSFGYCLMSMANGGGMAGSLFLVSFAGLIGLTVSATNPLYVPKAPADVADEAKETPRTRVERFPASAGRSIPRVDG